MTWIDVLKAKIDALTDGDWEEELMLLLDGTSVKLKAATIKLDVAPAIANRFFGAIGHVNSVECAGMSPEKLMVDALGYDSTDGAFVRFRIRNTVPWTHMIHPATGQFTRITDSDGKPMYSLADFNLLTDEAAKHQAILAKRYGKEYSV